MTWLPLLEVFLQKHSLTCPRGSYQDRRGLVTVAPEGTASAVRQRGKRGDRSVVVQRHVIRQVSEAQPFATRMDLTNVTPNKRSQTKGVHPQCDSPSAQLEVGGRAVGRGVQGLAPHGDGRHAGTGTAQVRRPHAGTPAGLPSSDWPCQWGQEGLLCLHQTVSGELAPRRGMGWEHLCCGRAPTPWQALC